MADLSFNELAASLTEIPYFRRRINLWHRERPKSPRFLYKFRTLTRNDSTSVDRVRDVIVSSRLWFSSPLDFNDPFDMSGTVIKSGDASQIRTRLDILLKQRGMSFAQRQRQLPQIMKGGWKRIIETAQGTFDKIAEGTGVCSFAGDPRSILMWSHYGENHKGVCFQFEFARDVKIFGSALPVEYSDDYPKYNWVKDRDILVLLLRKFKGWEYEQERRIIEHGHARRYILFDPSALSAVIIGCRADSETTAPLKQVLTERSNRGLPKVRLYRAFKDSAQYRIRLKCIANL